MLASTLYYTVLKDRDWYFGRKFSLGILMVYIAYYFLYYVVIRDTLFTNWFIWIIGLDIFVLGVLFMKYKDLKFGSFVSRAVENAL